MRAKEQGHKLGEGTTKLLTEYRKVVPYVTKDRIFTNDLNASIDWLKHLDPKKVSIEK